MYMVGNSTSVSENVVGLNKRTNVEWFVLVRLLCYFDHLRTLWIFGAFAAVRRTCPGSSLQAAEGRQQQQAGCTCAGTAAGCRPRRGDRSAPLHPAACCPTCHQDNSAAVNLRITDTSRWTWAHLSLGTGFTLQASRRKRTAAACPVSSGDTKWRRTQSQGQLQKVRGRGFNAISTVGGVFTFSSCNVEGCSGVIVPLLHVHRRQREPAHADLEVNSLIPKYFYATRLTAQT